MQYSKIIILARMYFFWFSYVRGVIIFQLVYRELFVRQGLINN